MFVLRFAASSDWAGQYVALDSASGGYPYAVGDNVFRAKVWDSEEKALDYASSFKGYDSYSAYAIVQKAFAVTVEVEQ